MFCGNQGFNKMFFVSRVFTIVNNFWNKVIIKHHSVQVESVSINGRIRLVGTGKIKIGNNTKINSGKAFNAIGGDIQTVLSAIDSAEIIIGDNVGISNSAIIARESIVIEDNVLIGGSCKIYDSDFHSLHFGKRMQIPDTDIKTKAVRIKQGAFIGAHSIILKGVTIGEKSIVGAGSVVTKDIPANEIWAGNPAKFIKEV